MRPAFPISKPKSPIHELLKNVGFAILCADDNYFNIETLRLVFAKLELQDYCSYVHDGKEVVEWCQRNFQRAKETCESQIFVLLTDLELPFKNGIQAVKEVKKLYSSQELSGDTFKLQMPTFILSSYTFYTGCKEEKDRDVDFKVSKPPDESEL